MKKILTILIPIIIASLGGNTYYFGSQYIQNTVDERVEEVRDNLIQASRNETVRFMLQRISENGEVPITLSDGSVVILVIKETE